MELLLQYNAGDSTKYAALAGHFASAAESVGDWHRAGAYWEVKAAWHGKEENVDERRKALINAAETHVKLAEVSANLTTPHYPSACFELQRAIEALRRIGGMRLRIDELHRMLLKFQEESMKEMKSVLLSENITETVEKARGSVKGKSLNEAIVTLARSVVSPKVDDLRKQIERYNKEFVVQSLFPRVMVDEQGKHKAASPSLLSDEPDDVERTIKNQMYSEAVRHQGLIASAIILPIVQEINLEHDIQMRDLQFIVSNNAFIPLGREYLYLRGLYAGFSEDFVVAVHLLVPQLENSIRYILNQRDVITSSLNTQTGLQEENTLDTLLDKPELEQILGVDIKFDLRGLLVERFGSNVRNALAHGLISSGGFSLPQFPYLWWLTLHLCFYGLPISGDSQDSAAS